MNICELSKTCPFVSLTLTLTPDIQRLDCAFSTESFPTFQSLGVKFFAGHVIYGKSLGKFDRGTGICTSACVFNPDLSSL